MYSAVALKGLLGGEHFTCWVLYVRACSLVCSPLLRAVDAESADVYFLQFVVNWSLFMAKIFLLQSCIYTYI